MKLNPNKTALAVGAFAASWHLIWGLLVAANVANTILDFIYGIHFLSNPFTVQPFTVVKWVTLVVVTAVLGYIF
ncbi:hypothetical protein HY310_00985, partial [Candidatus Microgenomates bacterium]|nr:hypothetical protein [Candidatus Microgenomates bacterium]